MRQKIMRAGIAFLLTLSFLARPALFSIPAAAAPSSSQRDSAAASEADTRFMSELFFGSDGTTHRVTDGSIVLPLGEGGKSISYSTVTVPHLYDTPNNAVRFVIANYSAATYFQVKYTYVTDFGPCTETQRVEIGAYNGRSTYLLRIPQIDSVVNMTLILPETTGNSLMLYGMEAVRLWSDEMASVQNGTIQSCIYREESKTVTVKGSVYHDVMIAAGGGILELYRLEPGQSVEELLEQPEVKPVAQSAISIGFQLQAAATDLTARFARYAVLICKPDGTRLPLCTPQYAVTDENVTAVTGDRSDFKGIDTTLISSAIDSNVGSAIVDVYLDRLENVQSSGYLYMVENHYFYFDRAYLSALDEQIRSLSGAACKVYLRFLVEDRGSPISCVVYEEEIPAEATEGEATAEAVPSEPVPTPDAETAYCLLRADDYESMRDLYAYTSFLVSRYADTDIGDIAGIIVGSRMDEAELYHAMGEATLPEYVDAYGQALSVISETAKDILPELSVIVPVSDRWNAAMIGAEHRYGQFTVELFVESLAAYLSTYGTGAFTVMIESTHNPYDLNNQYFEPINTDGITDEDLLAELRPKLTPATQDSAYLSSENIVLLDNYLAIHAARYDSLSPRYYFCWSPDENTGGNALSASYVYHYYRLFHDSRAAAFFVSFREKEESGNLTEFSKIKYLVKYIDTSSGSYRTAFALDIFNVSSWQSLISDFRRDQLEHTNLMEGSFTEYDDSQVLGSYMLFDFTTAGSTRGWYEGNHCRSLSVITTSLFGKTLNAQMTADLSALAEYSDMAYRFETPLSLEYAPYITVTLGVSSQSDRDAVYEVKLSLGSDAGYLEAKQVVRNGEEVTLTLNASHFASVSRMEYMRLSAKTVMGSEETFTLHVKQIRLDSREHDSAALKIVMDESQSKLMAISLENAAVSAADRRMLIILCGAVLMATMFAALALTHYQNNAPESEDERDPK